MLYYVTLVVLVLDLIFFAQIFNLLGIFRPLIGSQTRGERVDKVPNTLLVGFILQYELNKA